MAATAEELKELVFLARESGDVDLEIKALEQLTSLQQPQNGFDIDQQAGQQKTSRNRGNVNLIKKRQSQSNDLVSMFESGQIKASDLQPDEIEFIRKKRIEAIPEITGRLKNLSNNLQFTDALAALTAFDPVEFGNILTKADPNIGVSTTPKGEQIAVNNKTGETFSINKIGPSLMDAVQLGGAIAAFTPAGRLAGGLGKAALASAGTQALIEAGQAESGGEFNPTDVAIAGASVPVAAKLIQAAGGVLQSLRTTIRQGATEGQRATISAAKESPASWMFGRETPTKRAIRESIESGRADPKAAKYIIDSAGKTRTNPSARSALRYGVDEGVISQIVGANSADKKQFAKMFSIVGKGLRDRNFRNRTRPSDGIGESFENRIKVLINKNREAGTQINNVAKRDLIGKQVNLDESLSKMLDDLEEIGVTVGDDFKPIYDDLSVTGSANRTLIEEALLKAKAIGNDAYKAHKAKRILGDMLDFDTQATGISGNVERIVKDYRESIKGTLNNNFNEYGKLNTKFSETRSAIDDLQKVLGTKIKLNSPNLAKALGQESRVLLGNRKARVPMIDAIAKVDSVAKKYGSSFEDDLMVQAGVYSELERLFGSFGSQSFQGVQEKAIQRSARVLRGDKTGVLIDIGGEILGKLTKADEEKVLKSLESLLSSGVK